MIKQYEHAWVKGNSYKVSLTSTINKYSSTCLIVNCYICGNH